MSRAPHLHFVLDAPARRWHDIEGLEPEDIAASPRRFVGGRNAWVAQTYVRLKVPRAQRGWRVTVGTAYVPGAICLTHRDDANAFRGGAHRSFLVVVRADRPPVHACDLAIVQNDIDCAAHERYLPLWPQPGIVVREARRGTRIARLAYLGRTASARRWFFDSALRNALERRAVKLCNGWTAGAPVLASPEPAYRALRRSPLDYLEVEGPAQVLDAIDCLQSQPRLYRAMIANGRQRAAEFSDERVVERWLALLEGEVAERFARFEPGAARAAWFHAALARQKTTNRLHRCRVALQRIALAARGEPAWGESATWGQERPAGAPAGD